MAPKIKYKSAFNLMLATNKETSYGKHEAETNSPALVVTSGLATLTLGFIRHALQPRW